MTLVQKRTVPFYIIPLRCIIVSRSGKHFFWEVQSSDGSSRYRPLTQESCRGRSTRMVGNTGSMLRELTIANVTVSVLGTDIWKSQKQEI